MDVNCCKYHPDSLLIEDYHAGDMICSECGLVVGDRVIDVSAEWRVFSDDTREDPSRVGGPENLLLGGSDLSTIIGPARGEESFNEFGLPKYMNRKTMSSSDRTLLKAYKEIDCSADRINVPKSIIDKASLLFKKIHDGHYMKRRSQDVVTAACLYTACRTEGTPRSLKEISAVTNASKKQIGRCYAAILKLQIVLGINTGVIESEDFMSRFCSKLAMAHAVQRVAIHIARKSDDMEIVGGKSPITVAAASIYMASLASGGKKTPKEIGEIAGVSVAALKSSYKLMLPYVHDLFPVDFQGIIPLDCLPKS